MTKLADSSDEEYFSDASEGRKKASRPQTPASPVPKTRVERVDNDPAYGEVPGTTAYDRRSQDAVPDEVEVVPEGRLSKRSSQYLEPPTTPGGTFIPRTVVEKVDPSSSSYGDEPGTIAYKHRKVDSVPDLVLKAPESGRYREPESEQPPSSTSVTVPETLVTRVDTEPAYGEVEGTVAAERRKEDTIPDKVEIKPGKPASFIDSEELLTWSGSPTLTRSLKSPQRTSTADGAFNDGDGFGDDFDDFEEGAEAGADDDFDDFDDDFQQPQPHAPEPEAPVPRHTYPVIDFDALSDLPDLLAATEQHLDAIFPFTTAERLASLPASPLIDTSSPIFPSDRSRSLWKQLVTPPPLQPPNWTQSRIRRLFLVSLGVPVDLDEILPPSKQKKLVLPDINLDLSRKSESDKNLGSVARLKQQTANDSTASLDSNQSGKESKSRNRRAKGPAPPPELDLIAVKRLCATTNEKLDGLDEDELKAHVKQLEILTERTSELLEYWLRRRDGLRKEKEAFEGVIENLIRHMRK